MFVLLKFCKNSQNEKKIIILDKEKKRLHATARYS